MSKNIRIRKLFFFILFCFQLTITNGQNDYKDWDSYQLGCSLMDSLKYNEAIYYFNEAIKFNPENSIYYYKRGHTFFNLKEYKSAKEDFLYCSTVIPDEPVYYHMAGLCFEKLGLINDALLYYTKALEINDNDMDFYKSRAKLYLQIDSFSLAIIDYNYVLSNTNDDGDAFYYRGIANYKNNDIESACSDWENSKVLLNENADSYINKYFQKKGNLKKEPITNKDIVELPMFNNGSIQEFRKFIFSELSYPAKAIINCCQGTVILRFTVKADGKIDFIKVLNHVDSELDEEAIRIIKLSNGLWQGGAINGKAADIELTFPISFVITPDCSKGLPYYIKTGLELLEKSDYENAIFYFTEVIKRDPYNKEIINKRIQAKKMISDTIGANEDTKLLDKNYFSSKSYTLADSKLDTIFETKIFYDSIWSICTQNKAKFFRQTKWNSKINYYDGEYKDFRIDGSIICLGTYKNKNKEGEFKYYYKNGNLLLKGYFSNNMPSEIWEFYFENGKISHKIEIKDNNIIIKEVNDSLGNYINQIGNFKTIISIPNYKDRFNLLSISFNKKNDLWTFKVDGELVLIETFNNGIFKNGEYFLEKTKIKTSESFIKSWIIIPTNIIRTENLFFNSEIESDKYSFIRR